MHDAAVLRALLARVEAAEGPDKVLGVDILSTLCPKKYRRGVVNGGEDDGEVYLIKFRRRTKWRDAGWYGVEDKDPTESLDAAVALVERALPGCAWLIGSHNYATVYPSPSKPQGCKAATPALALCAALLRALMARVDRDGAANGEEMGDGR